MKRLVFAAALTVSSVAVAVPSASAAPVQSAPVAAAPVKAESVWCDGWGFCVGAWWRVPSAIMGRWWMG